MRWKLFFIDWLLWVDYKKSGGFVNLQTQVSKHAGLVDSLNVEGIKDDPLSIFQDEFKTKVNAGMRIVSRSQIEHWIAQKTETIKDTTVLHHFSNLALINTSENIRNSNKTTVQKNIQVGENPSAKLLWLAWFARASANKQSELANHLCTDKMDGFWADYIASFAECNEVVS